MFNESLIQRGRNLLASQFMGGNYSHLMFIDADIKFNPADILKMIEADKDIINIGLKIGLQQEKIELLENSC